MTKRERWKRFTCVVDLDDAINMANYNQEKWGPRLRMVVAQADGYFVVFNKKVLSKAYDEIKELPVVHEAWMR